MKPKQSLLSRIDCQAGHCRRQDLLEVLKFHDLPKRREGLCSEVKKTTSRGFCDAARGASSRSPDHGGCLCWLSTRPTGWTGAGPGVCAQRGKGFQWVGAIRDPFTPENQNCIIAFWNEWDRLWITFPFDPCWYLLSFWVITTSRNWSWQYLNSTSKMQIEKVRTYCNCNEKERLTEITQQPIAVGTQINLAYIYHSLDLSTFELLLLSAMTFILKAHLRDQISLSLLSWTVPLPLGLDESGVGLFESILILWNIEERILGAHFKELSSLNFHKK